MGRARLITGLLGLILVIGGSTSKSSEDNVPMRMADESLIVSNYNVPEGAASSQSTVTVSPDDATEYQIYQGVMGRPGVDFPVHPQIPATSFSCRDIKQSGYYADLETDCQVFHICDGGRKISFLCPNGTIFRQSHLICDWWFRVDCGKSVELYEESAEQLAADQKIYKERSDERERRKKILQVEPRVYALDEPYQTKPTQQTIRPAKPERNSKRVMDADFSNMYPGRQGKSVQVQVIERSGKLSAANERRATPTTTTTTTTTNRPRIIHENFQQAASSGLFNNFHQKTQHVFAVEKTLLTSTPPTTTHLTTPKRNDESEKQLLAESASFASHRGGRTFADFNNVNLLQTASTTATPYKVVSKSTSKSVEFSSANFDTSYKLKKTADRLKYIPFSSSSPAYRPTIPTISSTTSHPNSRVPVDDVYFTTSQPEVQPIATKLNMTSNNPDLAISLQELNIHKTTTTTEQPAPKMKFSEDHRDGLEVPPSSGPSALRSFALYFAGPEDPDQTERTLPFLANNVLVIPIRKNIGKKATNQRNVLKQVEDIVKVSTNSLPPAQPSPQSLPSSLTPHTKNSYNALFGSFENQTVSAKTTVLGSFTEAPVTINSALHQNDLHGSQSRGILEPDALAEDQLSNKVAPDLRELAQVFTKALSAYLDDPEGFRRVLAEIRPTEPTPSTSQQGISPNPIDYPSATQEEDEVLDFSDVTKPPKKKTTTQVYQETTTEFETTTTPPNDISNHVLPLKTSETRYPVPDVELTAPHESLDQSQSSYYTPSPNLLATTNSIAEEINNEFGQGEKLPAIDSNEAVDSYVPVYGSVDDSTRPRYGGFQNNSNYSPYGAELTTTQPPDEQPTTFYPKNHHNSPLINHLKVEEAKSASDEVELVKEVNNLATRPSPLPLSQIIETTTANPQEQDPNPHEINLELSPPYETEPPRGFFVTYTLVNGELQTNRPTTTDDFTELTETYAPTTVFPTTTPLPLTTTTTTTTPTTTTTTTAPTTLAFFRRRAKTGKSLERIMELQEALMYNTTDVTPVEKELAREMVVETMSNMSMSDMTATTLTKMMELAAKNETYRRLVLLLVNDRSGKNKTVEEARLSLLRALLKPVISQGNGGRATTSTTTPPPFVRTNFRRGKNYDFTTQAVRRVTTQSPDRVYRKTTTRPRVVKTTTAAATTTTTTTTTTTDRPSTVIGNLGIIRKTIQESKNKEIRVNSLDDAVLDSDSRAIELLRSLYSLAARWG